MKKNNYKLKKYLFGSSVSKDPWEQYEQIRLGRVSEDPGRIENPNTALMDNNIRQSRAMLDSNKGINQVLDVVGTMALDKGMSMASSGIDGLLQKMMSKQNMAYGGEVGNKMVEIEGGETVETPDGKLFEAFGPDHKDGGISLPLAEGSLVRSKKIKDEKGTMAEKEIARKKTEGKLEKLLKDNETDILLKNAQERTLEVNEQESKEDLMLQSLLGALMGDTGSNEKRPFGTNILEVLKRMNNPVSVGMTGTSDDFHGDNPYKFAMPTSRESSSKGYMGTAEKGNMDELNLDPNLLNLASNSAAPTASINPGEEDPMQALYKALGVGGDNAPTGGDLLGLFAQFKGMNAPMNNTLKNRATDTPNINAFEDFGKDGLKAIQKGKQFVEQSGADAEEDLMLSATAQRNRLRNTSRSANTNRALDIASEGKVNASRDDIRGNVLRALAQLTGQEVQAENMQDQAVMGGEQQRDLADRQDKDNFYTQLGADISAKFENMQGIGKNLNSIKGRGDNKKMIENLVRISGNSNILNELLKAFLKFQNGEATVTDTKAT